MNSEQENKLLSLHKRVEQLEQLTAVESDDFAELKRRGLDLRPLGRMIRRNVGLIGGITSIVAAITIISAIMSPRSYEGNFQLLVEPVSSDANFTNPSLSRNGAPRNANNSEVDYPSLLQVLRGNELLERVVQKIQLRYPEVNYESLNKNLQIQRIGKDLLDLTKIVEVRYKDKDPQKVKFILEEVAREYLSYSLNDRKSRIDAGVEFIDNQLPILQRQVNVLEEKLQTLQQQYRISDPQSQVAELSRQVREVAAQKLDAQEELQEQQQLYITLQKQLGLTPQEAIATSTLSQEPRYQDLLGQLKKIESQIAIESAKFTPTSPSLQKLQQQRQNLSQLLNQEAQRILGQNLKIRVDNPQLLNFQNSTSLELIKQLVDAANKVQALKSRLQAIDRSEASLDQQVKQFPASIRQYNALQQQREIATKTLNQLLAQRENLRVDAAQKQVPWEIISAPKIPRDEAGNLVAVSSSRNRILSLGAFTAIVLALVAAWIKEEYKNVLYSADDIKDVTKLPLLEVIPWESGAEQSATATETIRRFQEVQSEYRSLSSTTRNELLSINADNQFRLAFDSLYAIIYFLTGAKSMKSLVVTSASSGDGKTTVALHLAEAAAQRGKQVLLVDANLRQSDLHIKLGLPNKKGLGNLLTEDFSSLASFIQRSPWQENLHILTSGHLLPETVHKLGSNQMQYLIEQLKIDYDLIIFDTPPVVGFTDTYFLAEQSDGILMVVGVGKTKRSLITQALNQLNMLHLPILGVVANYVEESKNSYGDQKRDYEQKNRVIPTFIKNNRVNSTSVPQNN